ncbi:C2H2 finger domain-containing protein [Colletotrichum kahawae]|uniref:C2H2 finger domain-containing protein n=1 Tax=Colletotrichum kahawae TaxID=34407 RepID=A0AAD9Y3I3_COLKA|nr:C2H2 finger domain-containing protein [Colletotrichum kahawae]
MFDPSLLLSPHVFLLGVLFRHRAFNASNLTSPHHLDILDIHPGERELLLPLKEDLNNTFIFCRAVEILTGYQISPDERISSGMMAAWIKRIGEILGFEYPTIAYNLRYNAANAFDQSVDVSEALRNLAMGHGSSDPFQRHYLGRNISADLWGILRGQRPQLRRELKQKIRDEWTNKQATDDIERQIQGVRFAEPATGGTCRPQGPAQKRLLAKLTTPIVTTLEGQYRRRDDAINAVSAYCSVQEGCTIRRCHPPLTPKAALSDPPCDPSEASPLYLATLSIFVTSENQRPRRCFICIGQAIGLPPDDKDRLDDLTREFYTSNDLTKHFRRKHLSKVADGDNIECKVCAMTLDHKMHLQNHAFKIHGTVS